ncbi:MAG TPA: beta-propeller domain-containing protein, partial [Pyrinomonadaceae bacterium]|nr:beta-propeller domain-containing protein [Pyrinomonadaceae bacterium]
MKFKPLAIVLLLFTAIVGIALSYSRLSPTTSASEDPAELNSANKPHKTLRAFKSEKELKDFFKTQAERDRREGQPYGAGNANASSTLADAPEPSPAKAGSDDKAKEESITNTQHAGVDEGDIVKLHGDHLVILRRGRIFTVRIGDDSLKPIDSVNAYPPSIDPSNDWYDEMLIAQDTIAVIGYSYGRGGTEINLFDIDEDGHLGYRATYHLRSNDYYSSRNYASRLIGTKLIFYTP